MAFYRLSNRQQKELMIRGQILSIAIPHDGSDMLPLDLARKLLPESADYITEASEDSAVVSLSTEISSDETAKLLGDIERPATGRVQIEISIVRATLSPKKPRGKQPFQWAGKVICEGHQERSSDDEA